MHYLCFDAANESSQLATDSMSSLEPRAEEKSLNYALQLGLGYGCSPKYSLVNQEEIHKMHSKVDNYYE